MEVVIGICLGALCSLAGVGLADAARRLRPRRELPPTFTITPGIPVRVGGVTYMAVKDAHGALRFPLNGVLDLLLRTQHLNLNRLALDIATRGEGIPIRHCAEFFMQLGYSLDGFVELSSFERLEIVTPGWHRKGCNYDGSTGRGPVRRWALLGRKGA